VYEAFCIDPHLAAPTDRPSGITREHDDEQLRLIMRYGHPNNAWWFNNGFTGGDASYITRIVMAMATNQPMHMVEENLRGATPRILQYALQLMNDPQSIPLDPAFFIEINGVENTLAMGHADNGFIVSDIFNVRKNIPAGRPSPVMFRWQSGTPAGTQIIRDGSVIATYPNLPTNNLFTSDFSFRLAVPEGSDPTLAGVEVVGIHNNYAGRVWEGQSSTNPAQFQTMLFYIPRLIASAAMTDTPEPPPNGNGPTTPQPTPTAVRIQKIDALTRERIPGALMRLRGMSSHQVVTGDGQIWEMDNTGINLSQVLTAGAATAVPGNVTHVVEDGLWTITGLPFGFYMVEEERAPQGYSLLPQHTAYGFWLLPPNVIVEAEGTPIQCPVTGEVLHIVIDYEIIEIGGVNSIMLTFENYPFSEIVVYKRAINNGIEGDFLADATFRIEGFFVEGNAPQIIDMVGTTDQNGRLVFRGLPAGNYTITELQAPAGFMRNYPYHRSVNVSWGQIDGHPTRPAPSVVFFNTPKSSLEVLKIDGDTGAPLAGAIFELRDPTTNETWQATTSADGIAVFGRGSNGNEFYPGRTYILTEIQAPSGYVLNPHPREVVLSPGDNNRVTIRNYINPSLTIIKRDRDTQEPLAGAVFEVSFENGQTVTGSPFTTGADGTVTIPWTLFEGNAERTLIVTEIVAPLGYHLADPNWQRVTMRQGENNVVTFENTRMPTITIQKRDAVTGEAIPNAEFTIEKLDNPGRGMLTGNPFRTDENGQIVLPYKYAGTYRIIETRAARNYWLDPLEQNRSWTIQVRENEDYLLIVENTLLPTLVITKMNALTHRPVPLTHFRVEFEVPNSANVRLIGNFVTDRNGQIIIPFVDVGWYRITETRAAPGMALNVSNSYRVFLAPGDNTYQLLDRIMGMESQTPVESDSEQEPPPTPPNQDNSNPENPSDDLDTMTYEELVQFLTRNIQVTDGDAHMVGEGIFNWPLNSIIIKKSCAVTGQLLQGATFELIHTSAGESGTRGTVIGRFTTNRSGIIVITGLVPGSYVVEEVIPPNNFTLSVNNTQHVFLRPDGHSIVEVEFSNSPYGGLLITKRCEVTSRPLQNAEFRVTASSGAVVGTANGLFRTNQQGEILIPHLPPGSYIVTEIQAPDGFELNSIPQTIRINATGQTYRLDFTNRPMSSLIINKRDIDGGTPLAGARFEVRRQNGEHIGEFVTDRNGVIEIQGLLGWFIVQEIEPPPGFILGADATRTVEVRPSAPTVVTVYNQRLAELTIRKINSVTRAPLEDVVFEITRPNGARLVNPQTGFHDFVTDSNGLIHLLTIEDGTFYLRETRALPGFIIDREVISFTIDASVRQREHVLIVENTPASGLLIIKTDAQTGLPLAGVEFEIRHADGRVVTGQMQDGNQPGTPANSPQLSANGRFVTDSEGRINLNHLAPGVYHVTETQALPGYQLDDTVHTVTVTPGEQAVLEVVNHQLAGFRLLKIDSITREPIYGVEFMVFDSNNRVVGVFLTDNRGLIDFTAILAPGRYTIRETRPAPGYSRDDVPRTVEFVAGRTTEIVWENTPIAGQLQILKISGDANYHNGLPAGTPLAGAVFEIFSARTGNLVDRIISNERGMAVSRPLPLGRYIAREVAAPAFYMINPQEIHFEIEFERQIVRVEFPNFSANMGVSIRKTGPSEAMQGHNIFYTIQHVRNESTVPLADFFWRDVLPTNAVRVDRLITGTYSHALRYRVMAVTNRGNEIVVADNLSTLRNNVIELRPVHLGLGAGEYVTEITLFFGQVPAGFTSIERPRIYVDVLSEHQAFLPNGMIFANKVDVGGRVVGTSEWVIGNATTATTIFNPRRPTLPRSGW